MQTATLPWSIRTQSDPCQPRQKVVSSIDGTWLATFTMGAYTVTLNGPRRQLSQGKRSVEHATWVRTYPQPFEEHNFDPVWLTSALAANEAGVPDIFGIAMQYVTRQLPVFEPGIPPFQIAGNASYGPREGDDRQEGADFNDYLGIHWTYAGEPVDAPEVRQFRCLDCSGYVRMIFGFRRNLVVSGAPGNIPLCRAPREDRSAIPRRARDMASSAPGVLVIPPAQEQVVDFSALAPGDLVFFDGEDDDGTRIDHVGMFLGLDMQGRQRFISSRVTANGPTMSDVGGASVLDGTGFYAEAFRAARRL